MGADRQTSVDFWEGVLGMPLVFEQPNLDDHSMNHLYFDPGDGRLITIFTSEGWAKDARPTPQKQGSLHHLAFIVSRETYKSAEKKLCERGFASSGEVDRGFMDSLYFRDPLGQLFELACYKFSPTTWLQPRRRPGRSSQDPRQSRSPQHHGSAPRRSGEALGGKGTHLMPKKAARSGITDLCRPCRTPEIAYKVDLSADRHQKGGGNNFREDNAA